jgi:hypothetical protein
MSKKDERLLMQIWTYLIGEMTVFDTACEPRNREKQIQVRKWGKFTEDMCAPAFKLKSESEIPKSGSTKRGICRPLDSLLCIKTGQETGLLNRSSHVLEKQHKS